MIENLIKAKDTGLAFVFVCILVGVLTKNQNWFYAAGAVALLAMLWNQPFVWLSKVWFGLAKVLGFITTRVLLSTIFFVLLTPLALLYRKTHKNPLGLLNTQDSLFVEKGSKYSAKHLTSPF